MASAPPPSEPDRRISRIRLSSWWSYLQRGEMVRETMLRVKRTAQCRVRAVSSRLRPEGRHPHVGVAVASATAMHSQSASSLLSRYRHSRWWVSHHRSTLTSTSLRSLRSRPVTAFLRYYGRCDSCPALSPTGQVSLFHVTRSSDPSVSNHPCALVVVFARYPSTPRTSRCRVWASPFASRLASHTGRIEFLIVRMSRSPPVAPHPASRRRSYLQLQAGERMPEEDFHLPNRVRSQAH